MVSENLRAVEPEDHRRLQPIVDSFLEQLGAHDLEPAEAMRVLTMALACIHRSIELDASTSKIGFGYCTVRVHVETDFEAERG